MSNLIIVISTLIISLYNGEIRTIFSKFSACNKSFVSMCSLFSLYSSKLANI